MDFPSGDQAGEVSIARAVVSGRGGFPSVGTSHRLMVLLLASQSYVRRVKTTHVPSGDICGSPSLSIWTRSRAVKACGAVAPGASPAVAAGAARARPRANDRACCIEERALYRLAPALSSSRATAGSRE